MVSDRTSKGLQDQILQNTELLKLKIVSFLQAKGDPFSYSYFCNLSLTILELQIGVLQSPGKAYYD